jgi:cell division protein FtsN
VIEESKMSDRERRQCRERRNPGAIRGGTLLGIFIGIALGLAIAASIAYLLGKSGLTGSPAVTGATKEVARNGKAEAGTATPAPEKPRFDFYKILPGAEEPKVTKAPENQAKAVDRLWLQTGAFSNETDAENLKARLALSGWEAKVETASLPDKSVRYRVRLGPYDNTDELNRIKADLGKGGFDATVIKNP